MDLVCTFSRRSARGWCSCCVSSRERLAVSVRLNSGCRADGRTIGRGPRAERGESTPPLAHVCVACRLPQGLRLELDRRKSQGLVQSYPAGPKSDHPEFHWTLGAQGSSLGEVSCLLRRLSRKRGRQSEFSEPIFVRKSSRLNVAHAMGVAYHGHPRERERARRHAPPRSTSAMASSQRSVLRDAGVQSSGPGSRGPCAEELGEDDDLRAQGSRGGRRTPRRAAWGCGASS